jgi:ribose transport system ATP-binding protein
MLDVDRPEIANETNALELIDVDKSFPGVRVLKGASFACRPGEVHAVMGENGAGKSTLMRIIAGVWKPEAGRILIRGRDVQITGPKQSQDLGIAMVYQDTRLVPDLDVSQNIWFGREPGGAVLVDRGAMDQGAQSIFDRLGVSIALATPVRDLTVAERQLVEIARALTTDPAVLILDEPTSALDAAEIQHLFTIICQLKKNGTAVIFISHRLPEVFAIADRITVLKDGEVVGTVDRDEVDHEQLVAMMVGREMALAYPPRASHAAGADRLVVENLSSPGRFESLSFHVRAGEIVGFGGIQGNGQAEAVRALFGLLPWTGTATLDGTSLPHGSPARAIKAGIVYVPGERHREGLFLPHSIRENISLPHLFGWAGLGIVPAARERDVTAGAIASYAIKTPSAEQIVRNLSGGNQQKVVLGRWTAGNPRLFLFEDPTRGVDVATKLEIYRRIRSLAEAGAAVILVSSDLLELIGLSDRILVFSRGRVVQEIAGTDATEDAIVGSATDAGTTAAEAVTAAEPVVHAARRHRRPLFARYAGAILLAVLIIALGIGTSHVSSFFFSVRNLSNIAGQVAPLALVALGQFCVIVLAGIDLSVGPLISLVTALTSFVAVTEGATAMWAAIAAALGTGLVTGLVNAVLIVRLKIPDLIATLATYSVVFGAALIIRPSPGGLVSDTFLDTFSSNIGPVPLAALVVGLLFVVAEFLLLRGRLGQRLYGAGSSTEASVVVGINTALVRAGAYVFCSLCAAAAGLLIAARIGSGDPQAGASFTLSSVTAVVVGGVSVLGGRGTAIGVLAGAIAVGVMQNALNLMHVSAYYQYVWTGGLTLVAVAGYSLRTSKARRT